MSLLDRVRPGRGWTVDGTLAAALLAIGVVVAVVRWIIPVLF